MALYIPWELWEVYEIWRGKVSAALDWSARMSIKRNMLTLPEVKSGKNEQSLEHNVEFRQVTRLRLGECDELLK